MKTKNGFTLFEKTSELAPWLKKQKVSRTINRLQVHHMALPSYGTWEKTDKRIFDEPHFGRTESLNDYGKKKWNSKSANGKYIAQHFNIFPDGMITTGRSLNSNPIGITGWNDRAICIEIYGNFDKGEDKMNSVQTKAVIDLFGELCKRFKITPGTSTIRYHAWFTSGGTYLGGYVPGKSRKSCPGTNFFGGNTVSAYKKNFIPKINEYIEGVKTDIPNTTPKPIQSHKVKISVDVLNIRKKATTNSEKVGEVKKNGVYTIVKTNGKWGYLKSRIGWIYLPYTEKIK